VSTEVQGLLAGLTILVVEDDYYQAVDTKEAFERAGATIAGPFSNAAAALGAVERIPPDCAVIDINLGDGPRFDLARDLKKRGIPTVFVSGYQATVLPSDLRDLAFLVKPVEAASLVKAVSDVALRSGQR
jgi:DNA-binding NtrC family response regulator